MATIYRKSELFPRDVQRQYKSLGAIGPGGTEVWAPVFALEAGSIGGGGGGGGGIVQQGAKDVSAASWDVNVTNASIAVTGAFSPAVQAVAGDVAAGSADSGNPVKIGAKYNLTPPTLVDGNRGDSQLDSKGNLRVMIMGNDSTTPVSINNTGSDGIVTSTFALSTRSYTYALNGAGTWDRIRGDLTNGLDVDVTRVSGTVTTAESQLLADNAGFVDGTTKVYPMGYIFDEVAGTALTENDVAAGRVNANRAVVGVIEDGATRARYATVSAANALKVDGSAVTQPVSGVFFQATQPVSLAAAVPVTDNAGSLTVDAPVGTPVFVRLSDGAAALIGQKAMAASVPVVLASDQSSIPVTGAFFQATQPVSLATNTPDVTDRAAREVGRVRIWDGTDEATVIPMRTQPATTEKAIPIFDIPNRLATYATVTLEVSPAITLGVKELLKVWYTGGTKDIYIVEIWLTALVTTASTTGGRTTCRISTITTAPTGGTELTKADIAGAGASAITNTMATPTGGGTIGATFQRKEMWHATQAIGSRISEPLFQASNPGNGIILRGGGSSGISIDCERAVAHTALVDTWTVGIRWIEV